MAKSSLSVARAMSALGRALARIERQATLEGDVRWAHVLPGVPVSALATPALLRRSNTSVRKKAR